MDNKQVVLSSTWLIDGKLDGELRTYKIESHRKIGRWEAIEILIDHLNTTLEGVHTFGDFEARPAKAPLIAYL